jgi:Tol biopolymer transport system component
MAWIGGGLWATATPPFQTVTVRDSGQAAPAGGSSDSFGAVLSPEGRYVLFASTANNLVQNSNGIALPLLLPPRLNVFLRDRVEGTTTLVSANLSGSGGGNGDSFPSGLSADGRYALFESSASDLVSGDTNGLTDIFVRDILSNRTYLVSVNTNGQAGNGVCRSAVMTPDGRFVAFVSAANNLVPGDTNRIPDVFVRELQTGVTSLISVGAQVGAPYPLLGSESPAISADGRYVAFFSVASNLVAGVTSTNELYLRDTSSGTTIWVSTGARAALGISNVASFSLALSADGQFVAYEARTNPVPSSGTGRGAILRYGVASGLTDLVSTNAYVPWGDLEDLRSLDMTPDGRFIAFLANTNASSGDNCVYRWDGQSGVATLVSGNLTGKVPTNSVCAWPVLDSSGQYVAFLSSATNVVTNALSGDYHLYLRDVQAATTSLLDVQANGLGAGVGPGTIPFLSAGAQAVAFESLDTSLVANDRNHAYDVFVRDLVSHTIELISAHHPALPSSSPNGPSAVSILSASADGRWVALTSEADNLVLNDTNGFRDIFVRDLAFGTNLVVSAGTNGIGADGIATEPAISANGRYVAFTSSADNLLAGDTNRSQDVFVRDLQLGTTALVSVNAGGSGPGNNASHAPGISADGRFVLFRSQASNLTPNAVSGSENLFLRDTQAGVTYALTTSGMSAASMTPDGRLVAFTETNGAPTGIVYVWDSLAAARIETNIIGRPLFGLSLSPAGDRFAAFGSNVLALVDRAARTNGLINSGYPNARAGLRFSKDERFLVYSAAPTATATNQVYLYDFQTGANSLLSVAYGTTHGADGSSDSPDISADGRFVAYRSFAGNLVTAPDTNGLPDVFLYDRLDGSTTCLTTSRTTGLAPENRSLTPFFSADGRTLFLQSWASDLVPQDFNQTEDVLALAFLYASVALASGQGPTLSWPARPGESYQVQFKTSLEDPVWQPVSGTVSINGNQAQLTDLAPGLGQRFYRIVAF